MRRLACPCADAHRRLQDIHEEIHLAVEGYLDDNSFRRAINSAIQASRSVSFLVQKRKSKWKDFDVWYPAWQEEVKGNSVMRWGLEARNRIVKEEDLVRLSQATVSVYGERLQELEMTLDVAPSMTSQQILNQLEDVIPGLSSRKDGWVEIQRKWIDENLPEYELIDALRELYRNGAGLIELAHRASRVPVCLESGFSRGCITNELDPELDCLGEINSTTVGILELKTRKVTSIQYGRVEIDLERLEQLTKRYEFKATASSNPFVHARERMRLSEMFLEADGYSSPTIAFLKEGERPRISAAHFTKSDSREMRIAQLVRQHGAWPYEAAVHSAETWIHFPLGDDAPEWMAEIPASELVSHPENSVYDSDPVGGRVESLIVTALDASGGILVLHRPFVRTKHGIKYAPLEESSEKDQVARFLRPIWKNWPAWNNSQDSR